MTFRSKIDVWVGLVLVGASTLLLVAASTAWREGAGMARHVLVLLLVAQAALPLWLLAATSYTVAKGTLLIRSGPFRWRIPLSSITGIRLSRSILSGPALSLRRLRVEYGMRRAILISPADQEGFLRAIGSSKVRP